MIWKQIAEQLMDESDSIVYLASMDTYELKYMNSRAKSFFGVGEEPYEGKKCYELLRGRKTPCETCRNAELAMEEFCRWESHNPESGDYFAHRSKRLCYEGRSYHFDIAEVVTERVKQRMEMQQQLELEQTLTGCIRTLASCMDVHTAINSLLKNVNDYYAGERTYLFEIDREAQTTSNTYEYTTVGIRPELASMQKISLHLVEPWLRVFREKGIFYMSEQSKKTACDEHIAQMLRKQGIHGLLIAPLMESGEITGFLGVDNPRKNYENTRLLISVIYFLNNDLEKRKVMEELSRLSYEDALTGMFNRNRYNQELEKLEERLPATLGIVYMDLNGLKITNDTMGHEAGDGLIQRTANIIHKTFGRNSFRIGGDEFVSLLPNVPQEEFENSVMLVRRKMKEANIRISIGSSYTSEDVCLARQLEEADRDMYREKRIYYETSQESRKS